MPPFWLTGKGAYFFLYNRKLRSCYIEKLRRDVHSRDVARATRRRRRILQSRILFCFIGNIVIHLCVKVEPSYEIKNAPRGCAARGKEHIALRTARARRIPQARFFFRTCVSGTYLQWYRSDLWNPPSQGTGR